MPEYYVYMLESADGRYYVGYTTDLERRLRQHTTGHGARFTRGFGVSRLVYHETHPTQSAAMRREAELKRWPRAQKEALLQTQSLPS